MRESQRWALDVAFGVGLSVAGAAAASGLSLETVWVEWSKRTGLPTPFDPVPSTIAKRCREVQRGWSEEVRLLAWNGVTIRPQSTTVAYRQEARKAQTRKDHAARAERLRREKSESSIGSADRSEHHGPGGHAPGGCRDHGPLDPGWEGAASSGSAPGAGDLPVGIVGEIAGAGVA